MLQLCNDYLNHVGRVAPEPVAAAQASRPRRRGGRRGPREPRGGMHFGGAAAPQPPAPPQAPQGMKPQPEAARTVPVQQAAEKQFAEHSVRKRHKLRDSTAQRQVKREYKKRTLDLI